MDITTAFEAVILGSNPGGCISVCNYWASGVTVAAHASEACVERHEGSTPSSPTKRTVCKNVFYPQGHGDSGDK